MSEPMDTSVDLTAKRAEAELLVLTAEMGKVSNDAQNFTALLTGFVGSILIAVGAVLALDSQSKTKGPPPADWKWGAVALVPILISAYTITQMAKATVRSYYGRHIERSIYALIHNSHGHVDTIDGLPTTAFYDSSIVALEGNTSGIARVRAIVFLIFLAIVACLGALSVELLFHGRRLWEGISATAAGRTVDADVPKYTLRETRALLSYICLPRPNDFLIKAIGLHFTAAAVSVLLTLSSPNHRYAFWSAFIALLAFEFLVYQSRYMLNDWNGKEDDDRTP